MSNEINFGFLFFYVLFLSYIVICVRFQRRVYNRQTLDPSGGAIWREKMVQYRANAEGEDRQAVQREMA